MDSIRILIDTGKGLLALGSILVGLWLFGQALTIIYRVMGDNIGFLALIPTALVVSYLIGHAITAQKDITHY